MARDTSKGSLAVLGAGISGIGVALEAARRGFEVTLFEKGEVGSATSNNSLRIIHGGFRYLQNLDLLRVISSNRNQTRTRMFAPQFFRELPCLMPLNRYGMKSSFPVSIGCALFNLLADALGSRISKAGLVSSKKISELIPNFAKLFPHGGLLWYDLLLEDPNGFHGFLKAKLSELGVKVLEHARVESLQAKQDFLLRYLARGERHEARFSKVANCLGPWLSSIRPNGGREYFTPQWCKAFNILVSRKLDSKYALGLKSKQGRLFFVVPRGEHSAIGTWYVPYQGDPESAKVEEKEIVEFIEEFSRTCEDSSLSLKHVVSVDFGLLPMQALKAGRPLLYGSEIIKDYSGYLEIISTKYTSFQSQAAKVCDLL